MPRSHLYSIVACCTCGEPGYDGLYATLPAGKEHHIWRSDGDGGVFVVQPASSRCEGHYQHFVALDLTTEQCRPLRVAGDTLRDGDAVALQRPGRHFYLDDNGTVKSRRLPGASRAADYPSFLWGYTKETSSRLEEFLDTCSNDIKDALTWISKLLATTASDLPSPAPTASTASIVDLASADSDTHTSSVLQSPDASVADSDADYLAESSSDAGSAAVSDADEADSLDSPDTSGLPRVLLVELYAGYEPMLWGLVEKHCQRQLVLVAAVTVDNGSNGTYLPGHGMPRGIVRLPLLQDMADPATLQQVMQFVEARVGAADIVVVAGGPPCTEYSVLRPCNDTRPPERREADLQAADMLVGRMLEACSLVRELCEQHGKRFVMVMENAGSATANVLRNRPVVQEFLASPANADVRYQQMHQCRYGIKLPKKPTDVWTNVGQWTALRCGGHERCFNCIYERGHRKGVLGVPHSERAKWPEVFVCSLLDAMLREAAT